ncbi:hypothetical protein BDN71DRAFT_1498795 [Pleurotus eryngii]|uniref:Uncharacterized protein n=1 Tax=Pleurotus eryngii TaxID=5323 RepID=A0A9P5ZLU6_PLEER|nr:hypothetical protein BDN71DRAFT_1498795 [Pleurotus eryngii]
MLSIEAAHILQTFPSLRTLCLENTKFHPRVTSLVHGLSNIKSPLDGASMPPDLTLQISKEPSYIDMQFASAMDSNALAVFDMGNAETCRRIVGDPHSTYCDVYDVEIYDATYSVWGYWWENVEQDVSSLKRHKICSGD